MLCATARKDMLSATLPSSATRTERHPAEATATEITVRMMRIMIFLSRSTGLSHVSFRAACHQIVKLKSERIPGRRPVHDEVRRVKGDSRRFERLPPFAVLYARSPLVEEVEDAAVRTFTAASAGNQPGQLRLAIPFLAARLFTRGACTPDIEQISPLEGENKIRTPRSQRPSPAALTTRRQGTHFHS